MENKLEQLLNTLIQRGWKPFWEWIHRSNYKSVHIHKNYKSKKPYAIFYTDNHSHWKVLRQVTSKESWLWQFVCENGMVKKEWNSEWTIIYPNERAEDYQKCHSYCEWQSEYWILESALCDEDKLEEFLLNSIKLD
jgi:hypothetical protein